MKKLLFLLIPVMLFGQQPSDISKVTAWWRASDGITLDGSDNVDVWTDKINSIALETAPTLGNPDYLANALDSYAAVDFGAGTGLYCADNANLITAGTGIHVIVFAKRDATTTSNESIVLKKVRPASDSSIEYGIGVDLGAGDNLIRCYYKPAGTTTVDPGYTYSNITDFVLFEFSIGSRNILFNADTVNIYNSGSSATTTNYAGAEFYLGTHYNAGGAADAYFNGKIMEVIFANNQMSESEEQTIYQYFDARYGTSYALPIIPDETTQDKGFKEYPKFPKIKGLK